MKKPLIALLTLALLAAVVCYDLGAGESRLQKMLGRDASPATPEAKITPTEQTQANQDKLRAEAKAIWAKALKLDSESKSKGASDFYKEKDPDKKYRILLTMGITLSRGRFDECLRELNGRKEGEIFSWTVLAIFIKAWCDESPREAVAWAFAMKESEYPMRSHLYVSYDDEGVFGGIHRYLYYSLKATQRDPAAWAAFLAESPDAELVAAAQHWLKEIQEPGSIWSQPQIFIGAPETMMLYLLDQMDGNSPQVVMESLRQCPSSNFRGIAARRAALTLSPEVLRQLAASDLFGDELEMPNLLLVLAGEGKASSLDAAAFLFGLRGHRTAENLAAVYAKWPEGQLGVGLSQVMKHGKFKEIESFVNEMIQRPSASESFIVSSLTDSLLRDKALVAYYTALSHTDPASTLARIMQSEAIEDQVDAAGVVLNRWAKESPKSAVSWFKKLPNAKEHPDLVVAIVESWSGKDLFEAVTFSLEQGVGLKHGIMEGLVTNRRLRSVSSDERKLVYALLRNEPEYNQFVISSAFEIYYGSELALKEIAEHAQAGWQTQVVDQVNTWLDTGDKRGTFYLPALSSLDLSSMPPEKIQQLRKPRPQP